MLNKFSLRLCLFTASTNSVMNLYRVPIFVVGLLYMIAGTKRVTDKGFINQYGMLQVILDLLTWYNISFSVIV